MNYHTELFKIPKNSNYSDDVILQSDITASQIVSRNILEYMKHVALTKLPNEIDGLKQGTRRALWVLKDVVEGEKASAIIGKIMDYHVVSDAAIYDTLIRLCHNFVFQLPLVVSSGNSGYYVKSEPAQMRYVSLMISEFAKDVFFNKIDLKTIPMQRTTTLTKEEPKYFIPRLPTTLLIDNYTIGVGFFSCVSPIHITNVCDIVQKYIDMRQKNAIDFKKLTPLFIPEFPIGGYILNKDEVIEAYKNNNYDTTVVTEGQLKIVGNSIIIEYLPYDKDYQSILKIYDVLKEDKKHWLHQCLDSTHNVSEKSDIGTFKFIFKRNVNVFDILPKLKKLIDFSSNIRQIPTYVDEYGKLKTCTIPHLLQKWYTARFSSVYDGITIEYNTLVKTKRELAAKLIICERTKEAIDILTSTNSGSSYETLLNKMMKTFDLSLYQAKILADVPIKNIANFSKKLLTEEMENICKKINIVFDKFSKIDEIIYNDAEYFKKKYKIPRRIKYGNYIGYVKLFHNGIVQFDSKKEMFEILSNNSNTVTDIHLYKPNNKQKVLIQNNRTIVKNNLSVFSHDITGDKIVDLPGNEYCALSFKDGYINLLENIHLIRKNNDLVNATYVHDKFFGIHKSGEISINKISDISKKAGRGSKTDYIDVYQYYKNSIVFHMSKAEPNILRISKIIEDNPTNKVVLPLPIEDVIILDIAPINMQDIIIHLPQTCLSRINASFLEIINIFKLFEETNQRFLIFDLNKAVNYNQKITRHPSFKGLMLLEIEL